MKTLKNTEVYENNHHTLFVEKVRLENSVKKTTLNRVAVGFLYDRVIIPLVESSARYGDMDAVEQLDSLIAYLQNIRSDIELEVNGGIPDPNYDEIPF